MDVYDIQQNPDKKTAQTQVENSAKEIVLLSFISFHCPWRVSVSISRQLNYKYIVNDVHTMKSSL